MNRYKINEPLSSAPVVGQIWKDIFTGEMMQLKEKFNEEWDIDYLDPNTYKPYPNRCANCCTEKVLNQRFKRIK